MFEELPATGEGLAYARTFDGSKTDDEFTPHIHHGKEQGKRDEQESDQHDGDDGSTDGSRVTVTADDIEYTYAYPGKKTQNNQRHGSADQEVDHPDAESAAIPTKRPTGFKIMLCAGGFVLIHHADDGGFSRIAHECQDQPNQKGNGNHDHAGPDNGLDDVRLGIEKPAIVLVEPIKCLSSPGLSL